MNITHAVKEEVAGDKLIAIFNRQMELMNKYHDIEKRSGLLQTESCPVNINDKKGQARIKDFAWRITEEVGEALDAHVADDFEHTVEELIDGLHFLTELTILSGNTPNDIVYDNKNGNDLLLTLYCQADCHTSDKEVLPKLVTEFVMDLGMMCNCLKKYAESVRIARKILTGDSAPIIADLTKQMQKHSDNLDFEAAAQIRDKIAALTQTSTHGKRQNNAHSAISDWDKNVSELEKWLGIKIDLVGVFDNSHLFGKQPVGAMITFNHNGFEKSGYRHFKLIDKSRAGNDIAMMAEFVRRATERDPKLSLIIVDGGPAQWNIANKNSGGIPVMGVTKGEVRDGDEHFILPDGTVYRDLPKDSPLFLMLRAVRDEAHRFVITYHRNVRAKQMTASVLDEIEGIGPTRKQALLRHFGNVRAIIDADINALKRVPGLGKNAAEKIYAHFHS